jgi:hypothetical protein
MISANSSKELRCSTQHLRVPGRSTFEIFPSNCRRRASRGICHENEMGHIQSTLQTMSALERFRGNLAKALKRLNERLRRAQDDRLRIIDTQSRKTGTTVKVSLIDAAGTGRYDHYRLIGSGDVRVKSVLAIGLAVAQLLSWGTPAIHLCLCSDGSVCVDSGPDNCRCSAAKRLDLDDCCCDHKPCGSDVPDARESHACATITGFDRFDCTHIQLSWSQPPSLSALPNVAVSARMPAHAALCPHNDGSMSAGRTSENLALRRSLPANWPLVERSAVNLRC